MGDLKLTPKHNQSQNARSSSMWEHIRLGNVRMKPKLIGLLLFVGLTPLIIATVLGIWRSSDAMQDQAYNELEAVENIKKNQIERFFLERQGDISVLANTVNALRQEGFAKLSAIQTLKKKQLEDYFETMCTELTGLRNDPFIFQAMLDFNEAFEKAGNRINTPNWRLQAQKYDTRLQEVAENYGWDDLLLIHKSGAIVYTVLQASDLGIVIPESELGDTSLGQAFERVITVNSEPVATADFTPYPPADGEQTAFMMTPMRDNLGKIQGFIAFRIPIEKINAIVQQNTGLGKTGETYLVGKVDDSSSYRSDRVVKSGQFGDPRTDTYIDLGLIGWSGQASKTGSTGALEFISYAPLEIPGLNWAIFTTMEIKEIIAPTIYGQDQDFFAKYIQEYGYQDLLLIDPDGLIFYTVGHEKDFETNILNGPYSDSNLGRLVRQVLESGEFGIVDFEPYAPSDNANAAFIAQPVRENGRTEFVVALQLDHAHINTIMQERSGMGTSGETYLVGQVNGETSFRSDMLTMGDGQYVVGYEIQTAYIDDALAGNAAETTAVDSTGTPVIISYEPLDIPGLNWAIIGKMDQAEVLAPANQLRNLLLVIGVVIAAGVTGLAFFVAISIATPIQKITDIARAIARGDLGHTVDIDQRDETGQLAGAFREMGQALQAKTKAAEQIARGNLAIEVPVTSQDDTLGHAMVTMQERLSAMVSDVNGLIKAAVAGKLDVRADATRFEGEYYQIVQGINDTLDAVIGPLNVAAEYIDRISKGDIPDPITDDYQGDFNEVKNNVNLLIDTLNAFVEQMQHCYKAQVAGDIDAVIPAETFSGAYRQMAQGVNESIQLHVRNILRILDILAAYAEGDFEPVLEQLPGKQVLANERMDLLRDNLRGLISEFVVLSQAAVEGRLQVRGDATRFSGDYRRIVRGVNATIDSLVGHIDSIPTPAMIIDKTFNIRFANRAAAEMVGRSQEALVGQKCYEQFNTSDCRTAQCACARA
ncbi:MAG: HAMP domain-containing protein, partial [Anaerolineae bacterium]|nr:HAMP domain-containing protein [Anaerolineae bacterium]